MSVQMGHDESNDHVELMGYVKGTVRLKQAY